MRVVLRLLRGNTTLIKQTLHKRVVSRNLLKLAISARTQTIRTRVANMGELNAITINQQGSTGRTHTRQLRIIRRQLINNQVRALNLISQINATGTILKIGVIKRSQIQNRRS